MARYYIRQTRTIEVTEEMVESAVRVLRHDDLPLTKDNLVAQIDEMYNLDTCVCEILDNDIFSYPFTW